MTLGLSRALTPSLPWRSSDMSRPLARWGKCVLASCLETCAVCPMKWHVEMGLHGLLPGRMALRRSISSSGWATSKGK
jgi:hypothetical protein